MCGVKLLAIARVLTLLINKFPRIFWGPIVMGPYSKSQSNNSVSPYSMHIALTFSSGTYFKLSIKLSMKHSFNFVTFHIIIPITPYQFIWQKYCLAVLCLLDIGIHFRWCNCQHSDDMTCQSDDRVLELFHDPSIPEFFSVYWYIPVAGSLKQMATVDTRKLTF